MSGIGQYQQRQPPEGMSQAQQVASYGRGDDSMLVHVTPQEVQGLASMSPNGKLPTNPYTGYPEAGILSSILGVVGGIGGSFIGMPWLGAGLGSFAGGLAEGRDVGSALTGGILSGLGAYGLSAAGDMLGAAGAGSAAQSAAAEMAKNGVTAAPLSEMAGSGINSVAAGTTAAETASPFATGAAGASGSAARGMAQGSLMSPLTTDQFSSNASNIMRGASDPSNLWNTFGSNAMKTTVPIGVSLLGQSALDQSQQQTGPPGDLMQHNYPTLPGPNQRKYRPAPADWDYSKGREWNYWTPAFAEGGRVDDDPPPSRHLPPRKIAPNQFSGFVARPGSLSGAPDPSMEERENALIRSIRAKYENNAEDRFAMGGPVSGPGGGLDDAIPAVINGRQPAKLSSGEYVVPAHAVSALGDGSTQAGSSQLDQMVNNVMMQKYGTAKPRSMRAAAPRGLRRP